MKVRELLGKKSFTNVSEWKQVVTREARGNFKRDAYDENILNASDSRGHDIGYFNLQEGYGEIKRSS